ncbi:MAG TPA: 2-amino-4-hydroxy-6-hydroxymethyldihydropteridine diphosphokinase [Terriglobia bacterium]|jgi:2-amino-4-hydroxy-6-hydroxymethyldihydropteridine diphosphokinase|nr:2-amino-4-hydroxy-6-hydroxymethyldihydropteridine diphosphokinase [Terriglobia bacterium]
MKRVYLSLGSNLGDRLGTIRRALDQMSATGIEVRRVSSFYRTEPVEFREQPWFVNCVAEVATELLPMQLLKALQKIEWGLGRRRTVGKGPRTIDIDILLYENAVVRSATLTIPHAGMAERRFVLIPLCELAAHLRHPVTDRTVVEMLNETQDRGQVIRIRPEDIAAGHAPARARGHCEYGSRV